MEVILLSQYPELLNKTADLLNSEWKRSNSARVQSLEKSAILLPDSLLLIEDYESGKQVIGHSRLTRVLEDPYGCWIGSVVISKDKRKKGYGKYLMQKTEEYAKTFQFTTAYLNTRDQQGFYEHLGYTYCDPVSSISGNWNGYIPQNIFRKTETNQSSSSYNQNGNIPQPQPSVTENILGPLPPPPPPPPPMKLNINNQLKTNLGQYWMKKNL